MIVTNRRQLITEDLPGLEAEARGNICGPFVLRVPNWVASPLGTYYVYWSNHSLLDAVRMAYGDVLVEAGMTYQGKVFELADLTTATGYTENSGSFVGWPFIQVDNDAELMWMASGVDYDEVGRTSIWVPSEDGITWDYDDFVVAGPNPAERTQFIRTFSFGGSTYAIAGSTTHVWETTDPNGREDFTPQAVEKTFLSNVRVPPPNGTTAYPRHGTTRMRGDVLQMFWSRRGDSPECIQYSELDLSRSSFDSWKLPALTELMRAEEDWEGADVAAAPSGGGAITTHVNQLRDPMVFIDIDDSGHMVYAAAGEESIGIADVDWEDPLDPPIVGTLSTYGQNKLVDLLLGTTFARPATVYLAAYVAGVEVSGGSYARKAVTNNATNFPAASNRIKSLAGGAAFVTATGVWGEVDEIRIFDHLTAGNQLAAIPLPSSTLITNAGDNQAILEVGTLQITMLTGCIATAHMNGLLDHMFGGGDYTPQATLRFALYQGNPQGAGSEITGTGYVQDVITNDATEWNAASGGIATNINTVNSGTVAVDWSSPVSYWALRNHANNAVVASGQRSKLTVAAPTNAETVSAGKLKISLR